MNQYKPIYPMALGHTNSTCPPFGAAACTRHFAEAVKMQTDPNLGKGWRVWAQKLALRGTDEKHLYNIVLCEMARISAAAQIVKTHFGRGCESSE